MISKDEYNSLAKNILADHPDWLDKFVDLAAWYYETEPCGGSLHIALDDGNLDDEAVAWCAGYAFGSKDEFGNQIANLMMLMTEKQRERVYENYRRYGV